MPTEKLCTYFTSYQAFSPDGNKTIVGCVMFTVRAKEISSPQKVVELIRRESDPKIPETYEIIPMVVNKL